MIERPPNRLRDLAKVKGVTRLELAAAVGLTEDRIRQLEKPETEIRTRHAEAFATLLGVDPAQIVGWDRKPVEQAA
jgi:transcriptional regulator with XRE-family HTH domain